MRPIYATPLDARELQREVALRSITFLEAMDRMLDGDAPEMGAWMRSASRLGAVLHDLVDEEPTSLGGNDTVDRLCRMRDNARETAAGLLDDLIFESERDRDWGMLHARALYADLYDLLLSSCPDSAAYRVLPVRRTPAGLQG